MRGGGSWGKIAVVWVFYVGAGFFAVAFGVSVLRDRRRFRNAVLLGLTGACLALGLLGESTRLSPVAFDLLVFALLVVPALAVLVLAGFLLVNGVTMLRREGRRPANLLSLLAGVACLVVALFPVLAVYTGNRAIGVTSLVLLLLAAYFSFLFCSYLVYAMVYGRLAARPGAGFVVVLGSGLIKGRVPPLLAARLDRAASLWLAERAQGRDPFLITSGGQGPDEPVAESWAMADYLVEHGVPEDRILREDRSRTTRENLTFSKALMAERDAGARCVIVTNNYHVFRAALTARRVRLDGQVLGAPTARYYWPSATIREFVAILLEHPFVNATICVLLVAFGIAIGVE